MGEVFRACRNGSWFVAGRIRLLNGLGFPVNSVYTEAVLLPILGPASTLCLRRVGSWAAATRTGSRWTPGSWPGTRAG